MLKKLIAGLSFATKFEAQEAQPYDGVLDLEVASCVASTNLEIYTLRQYEIVLIKDGNQLGYIVPEGKDNGLISVKPICRQDNIGIS